MISIIYPYRNRSLDRLNNSLNSLRGQNNLHFKVYFIDYGSDQEMAEDVKDLCSNYDFVEYIYCPTQFQPWNKSKAINSLVKHLKSGYCFVADVDMIFHPGFVEKLISLQNPKQVIYFQVGYLKANEDLNGKTFETFKDYRKSTNEATGMTLFPVSALHEIRGFDEFYHFWGAEDTDVQVRLRNAGYEVRYHEKEVLMVHQWHFSYQSSERKYLTKELQIGGIIQLNHQHLKFAIDKKVTKVNLQEWGVVLKQSELKELQEHPVTLKLTNEKSKIDDILYGQLPEMKNCILKLEIEEDDYFKSLHYKVKKVIGKKVSSQYSLKEINDLLLLHIISFYRNHPYTYSIEEKPDKIHFSIKL